LQPSQSVEAYTQSLGIINSFLVDYDGAEEVVKDQCDFFKNLCEIMKIHIDCNEIVTMCLKLIRKSLLFSIITGKDVLSRVH